MNKPIIYGIAVAVIISVAGILIVTGQEQTSFDLVEDGLEIDEFTSITTSNEKFTTDSEGKNHYVIEPVEKPNMVG